jgi:hypothetical protein
VSKHQSTITIAGVNTKKLEKQRKHLHRVINAFQCEKPIREKSIDALEGLVNMLDHWSDEEYYLKKGRRPEGPHWFAVEIDGCSREQAERVLRERLGHDEDYGFKYTLNW